MRVAGCALMLAGMAGMIATILAFGVTPDTAWCVVLGSLTGNVMFVGRLFLGEADREGGQG